MTSFSVLVDWRVFNADDLQYCVRWSMCLWNVNMQNVIFASKNRFRTKTGSDVSVYWTLFTVLRSSQPSSVWKLEAFIFLGKKNTILQSWKSQSNSSRNPFSNVAETWEIIIVYRFTFHIFSLYVTTTRH